MKVYKAAIVGCGNIHAMHGNALKKLENTELVAVCDVKKERAIAAGKTYDCAYYTDYDEMLNIEKLDVVHICLPHYLHESASEKAFKKGIHVLTEKPTSISVHSAQRMIEKAKENKVKLGVIFQNRYNIGSQTLKKMLASGQLGKVLAGKLQVTWSRDDDYYQLSDWKGTWEKEGGGVIIDQAIHTIDLVNWVTGGVPAYVEATTRNRFHQSIEVEDFAEGVIHYEEGYTISFMANNYYTYDAPVTVELHTEKSIVSIEGARVEIKFFDNQPTIVKDILPEEYEKNGIASKTYWGTGHIVQIEEFYKMLDGETDFLVTGEEALKTQKIVEGIYNSARLNRRVSI